jgi:hypothetical protein
MQGIRLRRHYAFQWSVTGTLRMPWDLLHWSDHVLKHSGSTVPQVQLEQCTLCH